ncbi:helicase SNF2 [Lewinellaceae bacterium SD302]|nr:helicase SNF2 [Lewinellaceae bacterium SD302]
MPYWQYYYNPTPKAKAGSYRRKYGTSWWGNAFLQALGRMDHSARLGRGKTYANKGLVEELQNHGNGNITAKVQGSRRAPYRIKIDWKPLSTNERKRILNLIREDYALMGRLLAGELPQGLVSRLEPWGINLFPRDWNELNVSCSCPDWATPCKHEAAVFYVLAGEIDADPFSIFGLRGLDLRTELAEIFGGDDPGAGEVEILTLEDTLQPIEGELDYFGWSQDLAKRLDFGGIPQLNEQTLSLLPDNPPFDSVTDFKKQLDYIYARATTQAKKFLKAKQDFFAESEVLRATVQADLLLSGDLADATLSLYDASDEPTLEFVSEEAIVNFLGSLDGVDEMLLCDDLRGLRLCFQFARQLAARGAFVPQLLYRESKEDFLLRYLPANNDPFVAGQNDLVAALVAPGILYYDGPEEKLEWEPTAATNQIIATLLATIIRLGLNYKTEEVPARRLFYLDGAVSFDLLGTEKFPLAIQQWLNRLYLADDRLRPVFKVEEQGDAILVDILVVDRDKPNKLPKPIHKVLGKKKMSSAEFSLLRNLGQLSDHFPQLIDILSGDDPPLRFSVNEFTPMLKSILPLMENFGLTVVLPRALNKLLRPRLGLSASSSGSDLPSGLLSLDNIVSFNWRAAIGDETLSKKDFRKLLKNSSGLVRFKENFAYLDPDEIAELIKKIDSGPPVLSTAERMQALFTEEFAGQKVELDTQLKQLIDEWRNGPPATLPRKLQATLRPYQQRGFEWLYANARFGFGSIIADDMGLGKTLQVITLLLKLKEEGELVKAPALVVLPTSLLGNWANEIQKFAPELDYDIYHGTGRKLPPKEEPLDVLLTTYGIARNETATLNKRNWRITVIDESQNIKNPKAAQTKAIKRIKAPLRVAMSGTPVENRLLDYWSVMDFTLPGYLSNQANFTKTFANPIQRELDKEVADRFKSVTAPFMLRRLKSDKSIIDDLPDKVIQDENCHLLPAQAALYQSIVDENLRAVEQSEEGIGRQGLILKLLTALKQVCNHPKQFLKQSGPSFSESGKAQLLKERLDGILAAGDKTLIFTQYREMGDLLVEMIEAEYGLQVPFLNGSSSPKQRDAMVERFQKDRSCSVFILSIKAGGTGLNLTAANHVIHYDLWWNPAVENQATDRAYRIGQEKTVFVHRLISKNTFEEKIDEMIKSKRKLAEMTTGTGETWIGKMSNRELAELVKM